MPEKTFPLGDAALVVELGSRIDTALNSRCHALAAALEKRSGVREAFAGYATVTVHYDPDRTSFAALKAAISRLLKEKPRVGPSGRLHRIPVTYDGPDLAESAELLGITTAELVQRHSQPIYRVFMVGFVPGFAYLGPLPPSLQLPRRRVPRTHVPAGVECALNGPVLLALEPCLVAVTGADFTPCINGAEIPPWTGVYLAAGERLSFSGRRWGARCYIGVAGGLSGKRWLGSLSTY